jgi:hypothetical protein
MMLPIVGSTPSLQNSDRRKRINFSRWLQVHRRTTTPHLVAAKELMGKMFLFFKL